MVVIVDKFYNTCAEKSLLATAFYKKDIAIRLLDMHDEDFFDFKNKSIFLAMCEIVKKDREIDNISLSAQLTYDGLFDKIGGHITIADLMQTPLTLNPEETINMLFDFTSKRKLLDVKNKISDNIKSSLTSDEIINDITQELNNIQKNNLEEFSKFSFTSIDDFNIKDSYIKTGFSDIDKNQIGFFNGELIIIAARPSKGKTALAINLADKMCKQGKFGVFISLEMSKKALGLRWIAMNAAVNSQSIKTKLNEAEKNKVSHAIHAVNNLSIKVSDNIYDLDSIIIKIKKLSRIKKIDFIVIDYLQLVKNQRNGLQRHEAVGEISRSFKLLALDMMIPVIALCQLNRNAEDAIPRLADLRESGAIEQDADVVIFLHSEKGSDVTQIITAKNRNGALGKYNMHFDKPTGRFIQTTYADYTATEILE